MRKTKIGPQIFAAISASSLLITVGFHFGWPSPALPKLLSDDSNVSVTSSQGSWIVIFLMIGMMLGSVVAFILVNKWGRKTLLLLMTFPLCISCVLMSVATSHWYFYLARLIAGIGAGATMLTVPMYTSEIAEDKIRGSLGILIGVSLNLGEVLAYSVGPWVNVVVFSAIGAAIPIVCATMLIWIPETPYYYASKGVQYKVEKSLSWLRGTNDVTIEAEKIQHVMDLSKKQKGSIKELFTVKGNRKALVIMFGLLCFQQLAGGTAISNYSTMIFDEVDSALSSSIIVIIMGVIKLVSAILTVFVADKAGRKPLLYLSLILCIVFLSAEGIYFQLQSNGTNMSKVSWIPIVGIVGYLISFSFGIGIIPMVIMFEIFPVNVKAFAMILGSWIIAGSAMGVTKLYQIIVDAYGVYVIFYFFAVSCLVAIIFTYFVVPETNQRSLTEIQQDLRGDSTVPMVSRSDDNHLL